MNATSSRAHTVFGINFTTIQENDGAVSEMTARMNLVDLAGSERAESTGATGDRLKEGCGQWPAKSESSFFFVCLFRTSAVWLTFVFSAAVSCAYVCVVQLSTPLCLLWEM